MNKGQQWKLEDLSKDTDYGTVNLDGIYDVDDIAALQIKNNNTTYNIMANWKNDLLDAVNVLSVTLQEKIDLGLCPESAYKNMIEDVIKNKHNDAFWSKQLEYDLWIHEMIDSI